MYIICVYIYIDCKRVCRVSSIPNMPYLMSIHLDDQWTCRAWIIPLDASGAHGPMISCCPHQG